MPPPYPLIPGAWSLAKESWTIFKKLWKKFLLLQLVQIVPNTLFLLVALPILGGAALRAGLGGTAGPLGGIGTFAALLVIVLILASLVASLLVTIATLELAKDQNATTGVWTRIGDARKKFWGLLWVTILMTLAILVGYLVFIVPGIIIGVFLMLSPTVFVYEGVRGSGALKRSRELVRGFWWTVFARMLVITLIFVGAGLLLTIPGSLLVKINPLASTLYQVIVNGLFTAIGTIFGYKLYSALKETKEKDAKAVDHMPTAKRVGLLALIVLVFGLLIFSIAAGALFKYSINKTRNASEQVDANQRQLDELLRKLEQESAGPKFSENSNLNYQ